MYKNYVMSISNSCYDYIIGLSKTECSCWDANKPADYKTSTSGLYLADLDPLTQIEDIVNCENDDVWDVLWHGRDRAVKQFIADTNIGLINKYKRRQLKFDSVVGEIKKTKYVSPTYTYEGVRMYCRNIRSGTATIKKISTFLDTTASFNILVYRNDNTLIDTIPVTSVAGAYTTTDITDLELLMSVDGLENVEYYFVYDTTGMQQADLQLKCNNCGKFKPVFNTCDPYYTKPLKDNRYRWQLWAMFGKAGRNDLLDWMDEPDTTTNYTAGLTLQVEFDCDINATVCKDNPDFLSNPVHGTMAHAILYKAGEFVLKDVISSTKLNRKNLVKNDTLEKFIGEYIEKYKEYVGWIVDNVTLSDTDCLECRDRNGMIKRSILS